MTDGYYIPQRKRLVGEAKMNHDASIAKKYTTFVENTKVYFMTEALNHILSECLRGRSINFNNYGRAICENFVREEGYENLMRRFKTSTYTLATLEQCINEAYCTVTDKIEKSNPLSFTVQAADQNKFFDTLKDIPVASAVKKINKKVCDATEEFVQRNINAKLDIEEAAEKAKKRIDEVKSKYDEETAEEIQQEQMRMYKNKVGEIKNRTVRNVYEQLFNSTSKCILENADLKDKYLNESGQFNLAVVEEQVNVMYTFLEMVNTLKIKNITNKYIEECISSIKS